MVNINVKVKSGLQIFSIFFVLCVWGERWGKGVNKDELSYFSIKKKWEGPGNILTIRKKYGLEWQAQFFLYMRGYPEICGQIEYLFRTYHIFMKTSHLEHS